MEKDEVNQSEETYDFETTFKKWCLLAYALLEEGGLIINDDEEKESTNLALRRMLALFIDEEEYEKCYVIKKALDENFQDDKTPLYDFKEI